MIKYTDEITGLAEMTDAQREYWRKQFLAAMPDRVMAMGHVTVFGIAGDMEAGENLQDLFYNPEKYKNEPHTGRIQ